ncbi:MAG: Chromosomal replication initiator protein DnaA [uncultured Gemmatimonadetes bacterium]|uniref:Chromosomal replication initiator protein DnaA n=1 Tax=uncultured Gemmatimonadota bacterium TaxID=203437 RepID=A0A6J4KIU6_9BACT|nr:MAG: Chromosomal replication initiator protein DnaA [uncultured Gemmatimonadota bacterium]
MPPYDGGYGRQGAGNQFNRGGQGMRGDFRLGAGPSYDGGFRGPEPAGADDGNYGPGRYGLGPYHQRLRKRQRPDAELKTDVEDALFYDTWVDAEAITVEVSGGVVTLRGELPDFDEIRYATDDAWDVDGVRGVRSELRVNSARRRPLDNVGRQQRGGAGGIGTA